MIIDYFDISCKTCMCIKSLAYDRLIIELFQKRFYNSISKEKNIAQKTYSVINHREREYDDSFPDSWLIVISNTIPIVIAN